MKKIKLWIIKHLTDTLIVQGPTHNQDIEDLYSIINEKCRREFHEDSPNTLSQFLVERNRESLTVLLYIRAKIKPSNNTSGI